MEDKIKVIEKHSLAIRWFHWINFPLIMLMIWSGILIYWANRIYLPVSDEFSQTIGINNRLADGIGLHFMLMWFFVRFSDFLEHYKLGRKEDGSFYQYVAFETPDQKYYVSLDMKSMLHPQTVLAFEMNEAPLSLNNGAPLRLIIPIKYGVKSLKRIGKIYFSDERPRDYWAERGYDWYVGL